MLIGIDASQAAREKKTGVEYLASQLILNLKDIDHTNSYFLFTDKKLPDDYMSDNFKEILIPFKRFWNRVRLPAALIKQKPDVFIEIGYILPKFSPKKSICFVHDLAFKHFPNAYSILDKKLIDQSYKRAKSAGTIIFISKNTKDDFNKFYPGFTGNQKVLYPGYDKKLFKQISKPKDVLKLNSKYFLYLGRLESRKNVINLLPAYVKFCQKYGYDYKLILAGKEGYGFEEIKNHIASLEQKIRNNIVIPGYIDESFVPQLYAGSELFIYPTLYEGFGLPVLEAMACGVPVICSDSSSLPEAGGDAAMYFDPKNPYEIFKSMEIAAFDKNARSNMIKKGFEQIKKFSYKQMAKEVLYTINDF